uniref:ABC transporter ATP-binding protein n=1 Tax=Acetatifactor sp. TaxID=1872090 RepID=UPI004055A208
MPLLEVKDLCRTFRQGDTEIHAVDHVCFSVEQGDMLAIVGQSGSGKTTLLNLLGCTDKPSAGQILLNGQNIHSLSDEESAKLRRRKIGYIYQDFKLLPILTARENILLPAMLDGGKLPTHQVRTLADRLGIGNRLNHLPSQLSGGQRQRVAIARALINQPSILLADEPTGNLDKASAQEIMDLLLDLNRAGHTIILVTHNDKFADLCPRKITISDGQITSDQ